MDENNYGGVGSSSSSSSLPPFLTKTYEMVEDSSSNSIVSWSQSNKSFIVWNPPEFSRDLLPRFFKHNNFSSFIRQLNTYGFRKADPEQWEFANDDFVRGQPHLMKNIHRRKPVHSHSLPNLQAQQATPLMDSERMRMKNQIERLTKEKAGLLDELRKQEEEREVFESQVKELKDRLQNMEKRQKTMVSFVSQVIEKPGLALNLSSLPTETNERKRRFPRFGFLPDEPMLLDENNNNSTSPSSSSSSQQQQQQTEHHHQVEQLESSIAIWENLVSDSCESMVQQQSTTTRSMMMTLDVDESSSCPESPPLSCIQLSIETRPKSPIIDMNSEPDVSKEQNIIVTAPSPVPPPPPPPAAAGVNDVFWQQFLTEDPGGSTEQREVQSERKDNDKAEDHRRYWWNSRNVNTITEQLGHLTSSERS